MIETKSILGQIAVILCLAAFGGATAEPVERTQEVTAADWYTWGDADHLRRGAEGQVQLDDFALFENDAPGAGRSEKGAFTEALHHGVLLKKQFVLDDARALEAHIVIYMSAQKANSKPPYYLIVNGHRVDGNPIPWHEGVWHWVAIDPQWLRTGTNEAVLGCEAPAGEGFDVLFARADEYERGGGSWSYRGNTSAVAAGLLAPPDNPTPDFQRIEVGATSAKSTDGGKTWAQGKLGPDNATAGEYTIRLSLRRHAREGFLTSPPIDLWDSGLRVPGVTLASDVRLDAETEQPAGTRVDWMVRYGVRADRLGDGWTPWMPFENAQLPQRFVQFRARLSTDDPLLTPTVTNARLRYRCESAGSDDGETGLFVRTMDNPPLRYSHYFTRFQDTEHPDLAALRKRLGLDAVIEGATGDFEVINRVRHHVSGLWKHALPYPGYPEWNAHAILDRNEKQGWGGMCMQFAVVYLQALQSLGFTARHVNVFNHETVEVYVDELGKWIHDDPESLFDSYEYNAQGEVLNAKEQHEAFLRRYHFTAERPIPWMSAEAWCNWTATGLPETPQGLHFATETPWVNHPETAFLPPQHNLAGFFRVIPRNDFLSQPTPRPLNNGSTFWPWDGYLNWYDEATPRKLQYALQSDREADFYPTLNRAAFTLSGDARTGLLEVNLFTNTPNFSHFEVNETEGGWHPVPRDYQCQLRPAALHTLQFRTVNRLGHAGAPSRVQVFWHRNLPYAPRPEK